LRLSKPVGDDLMGEKREHWDINSVNMVNRYGGHLNPMT